MYFFNFRPKLRSVFLTMNLAILILPILGVILLRLYDSELIHQTEAELIAQGAFVGVSFQQALLKILHREFGSTATFTSAQYGASRHSVWMAGALKDGPFTPISPALFLDRSTVLPRPPAATPPTTAPDRLAIAAGRDLTPILIGGKSITLAGIRILDFNGTVVATTGDELYLSLAAREEVRRALQGEPMSVLRKREPSADSPSLESISRWTRFRVFVATPVFDGETLLGVVVLSRSPLTVDKALYQNRTVLVAVLAIVLAMVIILSLLGSRLIVKPLAELVEQSKQVVAGKRPEISEINHRTADEVFQLSRAFASMTRTLHQRSDYIRTFASHVSHEFKTPLTSIRGTVELLLEHVDAMSEEERSRFLLNLEEDAKRLERLVRRLLELARADTLSYHTETCSVSEVLAALASDYENRGVLLALKPILAVKKVQMSRDVLDSILRHLIDNALLHGGSGVTVTLSTDLTSGADSWVILRIADNGRGIDPTIMRDIFRPFFTTARSNGSTGLGLAIVKSLMDAHAGSIEVRSGPHGTTVELCLPSETTDLAAA